MKVLVFVIFFFFRMFFRRKRWVVWFEFMFCFFVYLFRKEICIVIIWGW